MALVLSSVAQGWRIVNSRFAWSHQPSQARLDSRQNTDEGGQRSERKGQELDRGHKCKCPLTAMITSITPSQALVI